jgi:ubiquitin-protein ligase
MAMKRLQSEFKQLCKEPNPYYSIELPDMKNFLVWNIMVFGADPDSPFYGGIFKGTLKFPQEYPNKPPEFKFLTNIFHPNIYVDGKPCISILREGTDEWGYEHISERWNPSHSVNTIIMSVASMLSNPNFESPANIDASVMWKNNKDKYDETVYHMVSETQK